MKKNILAKVSFIALLVGIGFTFVYCSKDGNWDNYKRKNEVYDFCVLRLDSVFPEKAVGEVTTIRINLNTVYPFKKIPMNAKVIYNSGKGRLKTKLGRIFEPNVDYIVNEPDNIFEYVGNDDGVHKFTIVFFNDKGVRKQEQISIDYATMSFTLNTPKKITNGEIYQGDECEYQFSITPRKDTDPINNYKIRFNSFEGSVRFDNSSTQLNRWYDIADIFNFRIELTSDKSGSASLSYSIKNATSGDKNFIFEHKVKQREIAIGNVEVNNPVIVRGSTGNIILGTVKKEPKKTNKIFYRVRLKNQPTNYNPSGINVNKNNDFKESVLLNNNLWEYPLEIKSDATLGKYKIGVMFKDEYDNETPEQDLEIEVISGEPSWVIESTR